MKNLLKLIGVVLALRFVFQLLRRGRYRGAARHWPGRRARFGTRFEAMTECPVPIDNHWYRPTVAPGRTVAVA